MFYGPDSFYEDGSRPRNPAQSRKAINKAKAERAGEPEQPSSMSAAILTCAELGNIRCADVLNAAAFVSGHLVKEICGPRRDRRITPARMVYYWVARKHSGRSLPVIGQVCGGRDHSTVMSGIERVESHMDLYKDMIAAVERKLGILG